MTIENGLKKYVLPFGLDYNHRLPSGSEDHKWKEIIKVVYSEKRTPLSEFQESLYTCTTNKSEKRRPISFPLRIQQFSIAYFLYSSRISIIHVHINTNTPFTTHRKQFHWTKIYMNISFGDPCRSSSTNIYLYTCMFLGGVSELEVI